MGRAETRGAVRGGSGENQEGRRSLAFEVGKDVRLGQLESEVRLGDRSM